MAKDGDIKRYSVAELRAMRARGESQSDWKRVRAMTEADLERRIAEDPDWKDVPSDWHEGADVVTVGGKKLISLRLDPDVVEWFKATGPGYQTRMNAALRAYVTARRKAAGA
jgi:uncharacterized protein (DUF4415 family)